MKNTTKVLVQAALVLLLSSSTQAQWTRNAGTQQTYLTFPADKVGIGTNNPAFKLDIQDAGNATMSFKSTGNNASMIIDRGSSSFTCGVNYRTAGSPNWQTGLLSNDNYTIRNINLAAAALSCNYVTNFVGIGTTAPADKLTVQTATSTYGLTHTDGTITVGSFVGGSAGGGWYGTKSNHNLHFFTNNGAAQMTLTTGGNVGIGTTTPTVKFELVADAPRVKFRNTSTSATSASQISFDCSAALANYTGAVGFAGNRGLYLNVDGFDVVNIPALTLNVGIGTASPLEKLTVNNNMSVRSTTTVPGTKWGSIRMGTTDATYSNSWAGMEAYNTGGVDQADLRFYTSYGTRYERMRIDPFGRVIINTNTAATGYALTVAGGIICTELKVQVQPFPDYVFSKDYNLKSIDEVAHHINTYNRMPGMPSACEVEENGMSVGEMTAKVVEKVEENTLYIIQLHNENKELKAQLKSMQAQLDALKK